MSKRKMKVYIAGPYSKGDQAVNVRTAMFYADILMTEDYGLVPFCPHLTHFMHMLNPRAYEEWLAYDIEWLKCCDALFRIEGESSGADAEEAEARKMGIPVFYDSQSLMEWSTNKYHEKGRF